MARRTQISFATFNLYNLNFPGRVMYRNSEWTQEQYDIKIDWTARIIKNLNARVWGFQELWDSDVLNSVFQNAGLVNNYDLLTPPNHSGGSIACAAAVEKNLLVGNPVWIKDFHGNFIINSSGDDDQTPNISVNINQFSRPVLKFKIKPHANSPAMTIFVVHFKSKRPTEIYREGWYRNNSDFYKKHSVGIGYAISTIRRTAESAALRMLIIEELKNNDNPLVVIGDLNDSQLSNTLNILSGQPNYLLSGLSEGGSDTGLYSVGTLQEYRSLRDVYYTHIYQNIRESLDHILVSQEFYDNSRKRIWAYKGTEIVNDHLNDDDHKNTGTSDHGVVKSTFEYRPNRIENNA